MTPTLLTWMTLIALAYATLRYLPFIDPELSLRLQWWLREQQRKLEGEIEEIRREINESDER